MQASMIVVGFDGSTNAHSALEAAADTVTDDGVIHVVTAYRVPSPRETAGVMGSMPAELNTSFDPLAAPRQYLEQAETFLAQRGIDHKGHLIGDQPANAILDVADDVAADMIIVGSRGLSRGTRYLQGSVSTRVASHAKTSCMVIHDRDDRDDERDGERDGDGGDEYPIG